MSKYNVWLSVYDQYKFEVEADSVEHLTDLIHENPDTYMIGSNWIDGDINIAHFEEVHDA